MWQIMSFAVAFHVWREGRRCRQTNPPGEVLARGQGGFCWEGAAEGCFAAGDGVSAAGSVLQGMGSVLQLIPTTPQGCGLIIALVSQQSGRRCQAQECQSLPCPGDILVLLTMSVPEPGCVESGEAVSAGVLLPAVLTPAMGLWEPGGPITAVSLGGFSTRKEQKGRHGAHPRCKMTLGVNIWMLSELFCCLSPLPIAVPLPELDGNYWSIREESEEQKLGDRATPSTAQRCLPGCLFRLCCLNPLGLWAGCSETEVGLKRSVRAPGACEPTHFGEGRDPNTHPPGFGCDWCSWEALPRTFPTWLRQPKAFWAVVR